MKQHPFISIILLFSIQLVLYYYLDYASKLEYLNESIAVYIVFLPIPLMVVILNLLLKGSPYKNSFLKFSIVLFVAVAILYAVGSYLGGLGRAYQH